MQTIIKTLLSLLLSLILVGCTYVHPYEPMISQGNILTVKNANAIKTGMSKQKVLVILGTPVYTDTFHNNRWTYIYYVSKGPRVYHYKKMQVYFSGNHVVHIEKNIPAPPPNRFFSLG